MRKWKFYSSFVTDWHSFAIGVCVFANSEGVGLDVQLGPFSWIVSFGL